MCETVFYVHRELSPTSTAHCSSQQLFDWMFREHLWEEGLRELPAHLGVWGAGRDLGLWVRDGTLECLTSSWIDTICLLNKVIQSETSVETSQQCPSVAWATQRREVKSVSSKGNFCFCFFMVAHTKGSSFLRWGAPLPILTLISVVSGPRPIFGADGRAGLQTPSPMAWAARRALGILVGSLSLWQLQEATCAWSPEAEKPNTIGVRVSLMFCYYIWGALEALGSLPLSSETGNQKCANELLWMILQLLPVWGVQALPAVDTLVYIFFIVPKYFPL